MAIMLESSSVNVPLSSKMRNGKYIIELVFYVRDLFFLEISFYL